MTTFPFFAENGLGILNGIARVYRAVARVLLCSCQFALLWVVKDIFQAVYTYIRKIYI